MHPAVFYFSCTDGTGSHWELLYKIPLSHRSCKPKAAILKAVWFSDILTTEVYSNYQSINIGI